MIDARTHRMPDGKCDFCNDPNPEWGYEAEPISMVGVNDAGEVIPIGTYDRFWAACLECHDLIQLGDLRSLMLRAAHSTLNKRGDIGEAEAGVIVQTHLAFMQHRVGRPWPLASLK